MNHQPNPTDYDLILIPVPMPPILPQALQFPQDSRYVALTYEATNCYVQDGRSGHTESYWIYSALIDHFTIAIHLIGKDLGSDDTRPTHALLVDVAQSQLWVGEYRQVSGFLKAWNDFTNPIQVELTREQMQQLWQQLQEALEEQQRQIAAMPPQQIQQMVEQSMKQDQAFIAEIQAFLDCHNQIALARAYQLKQTISLEGRARLNWLIMKQTKSLN